MPPLTPQDRARELVHKIASALQDADWTPEELSECGVDQQQLEAVAKAMEDRLPNPQPKGSS